MDNLDTLAGRVTALVRIAGTDFEELSTIAGLKSSGHAGQIARGDLTDPRISTVLALATALATTSDYLGDGRGRPPSRRRVRSAIKAARAKHASTVRATTSVRKRERPRSGARSSADLRGAR